MIWAIIGNIIVFNLGFVGGCIWATGRTLDKVQDWKCRQAIRGGTDQWNI